MEKYYNLTNPQKNIFLREEYYKGTAINNISFTYCIEKKLNVKICQKVINKLIEINDALRIQIKMKNNMPMQYIKRYEPQKIAIIDRRNRTIDYIKNEMEEDAKISLELIDSKLYQFAIYLLPKNKTGIHIKLHHIIGDAWVAKILLKQFNEIYKDFAENKEYIGERLSYIEFIKNEENYYNSTLYGKDKEFWETYLKNMPEPIQFKDISIQRDSKAVRFTKYLSKKISDKINEYCLTNKITPYTFFMTVYAIYLYKTLGKNNFTIGTPLLNRINHREKQTVGMYIATVPIKFEIEGNNTLQHLNQQISTNIKNALKHQRYPYEKMLEFARKYNNNANNLFDTILSFQNIKPDKEYIDYNYEHFWNFAGNQQSSFEIHISDYNNKGKYLLNLDFKDKLVSNKEMDLIYDRLVHLIENIVKDNKQLIKELEFIPKSEILYLNCKHEDKKLHGTVVNLFENQVNKNPNNIAVKLENKKLTYKELEERVNILASNMKQMGVKENMPIILLLDRSIEMIVSMLAVLKIGAYYIPIDPNWPMERINYIIEDTNSEYILTHKKYITSDLKTKCIDVDENIKIKNKMKITIKNNSKIQNLSYIIYTSGSTGKPKGTLITHKNLVGLLDSTHKLFKQTNKDVWTLFHTYTFDFSVWEIYGCLSYGGTLVIVPKEITVNPKEFLNLLIKEKVTILNQTPAYFYKVIEQEKLMKIEKNSLSIRLIILGGEAVQAEPLKYWKNKYEEIVIYNGYGPTETTIFAIMCEITKKDILNNNIYIGYPLDNYNVRILNENLEILPIGCVGEICISGTGVCNGYLKNDALTKEKFITMDNGIVYKSGDIGFWDIDGRIKYMGRNDNQVKIRGFRIEIEEIEKQILNCGEITKVVVMPIENDNYTKSLIGFIETQRDNYVEDVIEKISKYLASYMIPKLYQAKEFPLNDNGKIDRKKLIASIKEVKRKIVKPENLLQKEILAIVSKVAKNKDVSIKDDFFAELGMDSLDIMQVATLMNKYGVTIQDINDNSTIEMLSRKINEKDMQKEKNKFQDVEIINRTVEFNLESVFLTGTTGFLGIHILRELIQNTEVEEVFCLIREKKNVLPENRLEKAIKNYFTKDDFKNINKIKIIEGDFEKENLGLTHEDLTEITQKVKTIVHCGANVKHYGKYNQFYVTNVEGTKNIIKMAKECNAKLAHISTVSVGGYCKNSENIVLTENKINIGQEFKNHVYMITKYEAECEVLKAIKNKEIEAQIFRLGNIMPRFSDGKFQTNKLENGFISRISTILKTHSITGMHKKLKIDLSPVDLCAEAIIKLMRNNINKQTIYHIFNNNFIEISELIKEQNIDEVSIEEQRNRIEELNNPLNAHLLTDLMNSEYMETKVTNNITVQALNSIGFNWNKIDKKYLEKILQM